MPLIHSSSKKARNANIGREIAAGKPTRVAIAIGYEEQRRNEAAHHYHPITMSDLKAARRKKAKAK